MRRIRELRNEFMYLPSGPMEDILKAYLDLPAYNYELAILDKEQEYKPKLEALSGYYDRPITVHYSTNNLGLESLVIANYEYEELKKYNKFIYTIQIRDVEEVARELRNYYEKISHNKFFQSIDFEGTGQNENSSKVAYLTRRMNPPEIAAFNILTKPHMEYETTMLHSAATQVEEYAKATGEIIEHMKKAVAAIPREKYPLQHIQIDYLVIQMHDIIRNRRETIETMAEQLGVSSSNRVLDKYSIVIIDDNLTDTYEPASGLSSLLYVRLGPKHSGLGHSYTQLQCGTLKGNSDIVVLYQSTMPIEDIPPTDKTIILSLPNTYIIPTHTLPKLSSTEQQAKQEVVIPEILASYVYHIVEPFKIGEKGYVETHHGEFVTVSKLPKLGVPKIKRELREKFEGTKHNHLIDNQIAHKLFTLAQIHACSNDPEIWDPKRRLLYKDDKSIVIPEETFLPHYTIEYEIRDALGIRAFSLGTRQTDEEYILKGLLHLYRDFVGYEQLKKYRTFVHADPQEANWVHGVLIDMGSFCCGPIAKDIAKVALDHAETKQDIARIVNMYEVISNRSVHALYEQVLGRMVIEGLRTAARKHQTKTDIGEVLRFVNQTGMAAGFPRI